MSLPEDLFASIGYEKFRSDYFRQAPCALAGVAAEFRKLVGWPLLLSIFESGHSDCWLSKHGKLHQNEEFNQGVLELSQAQDAFADGYTILVRHSEAAHLGLRKIALEFETHFKSPIDIQIFGTPEQGQGFDWHYDSEEVFVIQSSGVKEFRLRKNKRADPVPFTMFPKNAVLANEMEAEEIRCTLKAGDVLYIPAGYWHCAVALTPSFHLSIGVMLH